MKKILSAILAAAMLLSITACNKTDGSGEDPVSSDGTSTDVQSTPQTADAPSQGGETEDDGALVKVANPVKLTADGEIDMDAAHSYETDFEAFKAEMAAKPVDLSKPVSENAQNNPYTMQVFNYLKENYGKNIISCQQQDDMQHVYEDKVYYNATDGDLPAMKGFDFIFCTGSYNSRDMIDGAIDWATNSGGLVTFTWHWNVPRDIDDPKMGYAFYQEDIINFNPLNATTPGTKEYDVAIHDIDYIASLLQEMESKGITVLFRPYHEASGSWFWWGLQPSDKQLIKEGTYPETYQRLWYMMFDRLENYHKLSNLIWVWNGQSKHCAVDPNTYDISGIDYYASSPDYTPAKNKYNELAGYTYEGKMLAMSECGYLVDPALCAEENIWWLYYMPWNCDFIYQTAETGGAVADFDDTPSPNPERLSNEMIAANFAHENLISWKDLPDFGIGTHEVPEIIHVWEYFKTGI